MAIIHSLKCTVLFLFVVPLLSLTLTHCHLLSLVDTRCITRCHSLSLVVPLVVTHCHSLSLVGICCHSLYHSLSLVVICCYSLYHSLSLAVIRCHSLYHLLSIIVIRCHSLSLDIPLFCLFINNPFCLHLNTVVFVKKCGQWHRRQPVSYLWISLV